MYLMDDTAPPDDYRPKVSETHISVLFFLGQRAYKLKKAVSLGFVDLTSRERREAVCHREVALNRRLAPDVYLGVLDVVGEDGAPVDHLVEMRRMPPARRLSRLVSEGASEVDDQVRRVARAVAAFHASASGGDEIDEAATRDAVRRLWRDNAAGLEPFVGSVLEQGDAERVERLAHRYLDGRQPLFTLRVDEGRARDGHGDLQADDIFCLDDGPRILDCLEFDDRLRYGDVLADTAFLAMDLERLGAPALAVRFLDWYRELSADAFPASLAHHYVAYRAHVRAKVACLRHAQGDDEAPDQARSLLALALRHLEDAAVRLVLVGGLPGTGKSTLARAITEARGWVLFCSDEVRKELAGLDPATPAPATYGEGLYRPEVTASTYGELLGRAERALALGETVVLDASWSDAKWRAAAAHTAGAAVADFVELRCDAPPEVAASRIAHRRRTGGEASDATEEVARRMARAYDPWPSATVVGTAGSAGDSLAAALAAVDAAR